YLLGGGQKAAVFASAVIKAGHRHILKWYFPAIGFPTRAHLLLAAGYGDVAVVEVLIEVAGAAGALTMSDLAEFAGHAALYGRFEMVKYLHSYGAPLSPTVASGAAGAGHLEMLKWAHGKGCHWDEATTEAAAYGGDLEMLQWACEKGCPA